MTTFKVADSKVLFFCGNNVLGVFEVQTVRLVNAARLATKLRDFGTLADRETVVKIAKDYITDMVN